MDPITHAISGAALARAIPKQTLPPLQVLFLVLLTMAPDADFVLRFFSATVYLQHHRGLTHSLLLIPLWGWLIYSLSPHQIKANRAMPWLIGAALFMHIMLDLITTFGTMIIAPLSDWRASLDLVFIIDPFFTATLLLPLLLGLIWREHKRKMGVVSLSLMCAYLGFAYHNQQQAIDLVRKAHPDAIAYNALPLAFSPFHWQPIAIYPDHYVRAAVNLRPGFPGTRLFFDEAFANGLLSTRMNGPGDIAWQELPAMRSFAGVEQLPGTAFYLWFARYPVLLDQSDRHINFGDIAFGSGAPGVRPSFQLHIDRGGEQPRAWLIWRGERRSELTLTSAPFQWLNE